MPRIDIGEVSYFVGQFTRESERLRGALTDYRKAVAKLIADDAMQGEFITSAKNYYEHIHYPIVDTTIACLSEADTILKKYVADYAAQVDDATNSRLDSDRLEALYSEIRRSENALDDLTHAMESMAGGLNIGQQIGMKLGLETAMGQIKEEIKILERYLDFENSHINVMDDVLTRMYQVKVGVNEILAGKAFNGTTHTYDSSKMQLGWLDHLVPEKKPEKAYNFEEYTKTFVDGYWILSKNGVTDQEAAKATIAYNDDLKDGTIKVTSEETGDFMTDYMLGAVKGINILNPDMPLTKMQSFSIISFALLGGITMKGKGIKIPKSSVSKIYSDVKLKGKNYQGTSNRFVLKDDNHFLSEYELKPNVKYDSKGYLYKTDDLGRIKQAKGDLRAENGVRNQSHQLQAGGEDRVKAPSTQGDHGGHLIATRFDGSPLIDNIVAMNGNLNVSKYKIMENSWADALAQGRKVSVDIRPEYEGLSRRPVSFEIRYKIDNKTVVETFKNEYGGK
ncbi:DNA/RNA non-specific endonuclease [Listeria booriae]|uniref:DNA/RNA non-specific endonuclease n=1 Tax=Listeria booriae TaxID=1552123 RepID=UPI0028801300|nr:DNA/RNA non-specific endonuclease [Listeria booriae]MDT0112318.1 DNA/RNA non-specific endonuclease [Listeria booriae]